MVQLQDGVFSGANGGRNSRGFSRVKIQGRSGVQLSPFSTIALGTLVTILLLLTCTAGAYLIMKDDLVTATLVRHARMQHAYEDRITALRAQVDIVTSRQLLDQRAVETRVERLMARQQNLSQRENHIREALKRAAKAGAAQASRLKNSPLITGAVQPEKTPAAPLRLGALAGTQSPFISDTGNDMFSTEIQIASVAASETTFDAVERSLAQTEIAQLDDLLQATQVADEKTKRLTSVLARQGSKITGITASAVGGPLIELKTGDSFLDTMHGLEASLERLGSIRKVANALPQGSPAPGQSISSRYGARTDPFTKRRAVHGGLDFRAKTGVHVHATASGVVIHASRNGGYGNLVEIDHGNGLTTRYAHLSRVSVKVGSRVSRGQVVGKVGSTGRSTGPHLHYEVRRKGRTLNPLTFVQLGRKLKPFL